MNKTPEWDKAYLDLWVDILNKGGNHIYYYELKPIIKKSLEILSQELTRQRKDILEKVDKMFKNDEGGDASCHYIIWKHIKRELEDEK